MHEVASSNIIEVEKKGCDEMVSWGSPKPLFWVRAPASLQIFQPQISIFLSLKIYTTPKRLELLWYNNDQMAKRNYLIEGSSGTGKTTVAEELQQRGYRVLHGDRELSYRGDPETGKRTDAPGFQYHIWDVDKVREIVANKDDDVAFFCGGSMNSHKFIDLFDKVFVLDVDSETLRERIDRRTADDWDVNDPENTTEFVLRLHATKEALPEGITIHTSRPINEVIDDILKYI